MLLYLCYIAIIPLGYFYYTLGVFLLYLGGIPIIPLCSLKKSFKEFINCIYVHFLWLLADNEGGHQMALTKSGNMYHPCRIDEVPQSLVYEGSTLSNIRELVLNRNNRNDLQYKPDLHSKKLCLSPNTTLALLWSAIQRCTDTDVKTFYVLHAFRNSKRCRIKYL